MQDDQYISKAREAHSKKDYILCTVLLKRVEVWDVDIFTILVDCAYDLWKDGVVHDNIPDTMIYVRDCYARMLDAIDPTLIFAYHYIRLSHLYIIEGAIEGAMSIVQLASSRGHLIDPIIVMQRWALLKRYGTKKEAAECLNYMSTAVAIEAYEVGKDNKLYPEGSHGVLKMSTILMFCSSHMQQVTSKITKTIESDNFRGYGTVSPEKNIKAKEEAGELFVSLIREAYIQIVGKEPDCSNPVMEWFCSSKQWLALGKELESADSFYTLLAEEAYWEAYVRGALSGQGIRECVDLMIKTKRVQEDIYEVIQRAHEYHRWNMYCRRQLVNVELFADLQGGSDGIMNKYEEQFAKDFSDAVHVQRMLRGYLLRLHWEEIREFAMEVKERHLASLLVADEWAERNHLKKMIALVRQWRTNAVDLKQLKLESAVMIQYNIRGYFGRAFFRYTVARTMIANRHYMQMCEMSYDMQRIRIFKRWRRFHVHTRLVRCASVIELTLFANGFAQVVSSGTDRMLRAIRIRRRSTRLRALNLWRKVFQRRQRLRARTTIRFFFRDLRVAQRNRENEVYYKDIERKVGILVVKYSMPRLKKIISHWHGVYMRFLKKRMKLKIAAWGCYWYHRMLPRKKKFYNRMMYEVYLTVYKGRCHRTMLHRHSVWKHQVFAQHLQRFVRLVLARWAVERRKRLLKDVEENFMFSLYKLKIYRLWRWKKLVFLRKRHRHRCGRRLTKFFRFIQTKAILRRHVTRKRFSKNVVTMLCHQFLRKQLFLLKNGAHDEKRIVTLGPAFMSLWTRSMRNAFDKMKNNVGNQWMLDSVVEIMTKHRIDKGFWLNASRSVRILKGAFALPDRSSGTSTNGLNAWEEEVPPHHTLIDTSNLALLQKFKIWMAAFRNQSKVKRNAALFTAEFQVQRLIFPELKRRIDLRQKIQNCCRCYFARRKVGFAKQLQHREGETISYIRQKRTLKVFRFLVVTKQARLLARLRLQQHWRMCLACCRVQRRRLYLDNVSKAYNKVSKSSFQLTLMRNVCRVFQLAYCSKLFSSKKRIGESSVSMLNRSKSAGIVRKNDSKSSSLIRSNSANSNLKSNRKMLTPLRYDRIVTGARSSAADCVWDGGDVDVIFSPVAMSMRGKVNMEFQSAAFNSHLFCLKQNGVFIWDVRLKDKLLTENETIFCIKNCQVLFCPYVFVAPMKLVAEHFIGGKLVLCGGSVKSSACWQCMDDILTKRCVGTDASALCFHCIDMNFQESSMYLHDVDKFCRMHLMSPSIGTNIAPSALSCLTELSVDTHSFGLLGVAKLLLVLKYNATVTNLIIKCSKPADWLACYGTCIYELGQSNKTLKEFRFFGAQFPPSVLKGLYCVLANITYANGEVLPNRCNFVGFESLTMLEITAAKECTMLVQLIVRIAKQRLEIPGCEGLSVTVN